MNRENEIVNRYLSGDTLEEISFEHEISRERVRQLLARNGITGKDGGASIRRKEAATKRIIARQAYEENREIRHKETYGCSYDVYKSISSDKKAKFKKQKKNAKARGIPWEIKLYDWCCLWDGKWEKRGRNYGQYVMARFGDKGPYSINNVEIVTNTENVIERCERDFGGDYTETSNKAIRAARSNKGLEA